MFGIPVGELAWLAGVIVVGGIVTGTLAGLFGVGGGAILVPVLYEVFRVLGVAEEIRMQVCIGTSLAIIVPTTLRSYLYHRTTGAVIPGILRLWSVPAVIGVAIGAAIAAFAHAAVFKIAFTVIATVIAIKLLFGTDAWRIANELPGRIVMSIYGFIVGLCSSLMGVSAGSVANMILTLYGKPIHRAVATSAGLGVPITIAGTIGYMLAGLPRQGLTPPFSIGFVSLVGLVLMAPISSFVAPYGARLAHALSRRHLEIIFGLFLVLISVRFIVSLVW
jgi:uncharacterized protein